MKLQLSMRKEKKFALTNDDKWVSTFINFRFYPSQIILDQRLNKKVKINMKQIPRDWLHMQWISSYKSLLLHPIRIYSTIPFGILDHPVVLCSADPLWQLSTRVLTTFSEVQIFHKNPSLNPLTALPFSFQFLVSTLDIYICSMQGGLSTH